MHGKVGAEWSTDVGLGPEGVALAPGSPVVRNGCATRPRGSWVQIPPPIWGHTALPVLVSSWHLLLWDPALIPH